MNLKEGFSRLAVLFSVIGGIVGFFIAVDSLGRAPLAWIVLAWFFAVVFWGFVRLIGWTAVGFKSKDEK